MFKHNLILAFILLVFACNQNPVSTITAHKSLADSLHVADTALKTISPARLIVPGKRVGMININGNADSLTVILGKPNTSDAAMGAQMMAWVVEHDKKSYRTTVYSLRNMGGADEAVSHIKEIRITSPWYKTADYAGAGSELKDIKKLYKLKSRFANNTKKLWLYDDANAGIAFEVDSTQRCVAVMVHAKEDSTVTYIDMRQ